MSNAEISEKQELLHLDPPIGPDVDIEAVSLGTEPVSEASQYDEEVVGGSLWLEKCITCSVFTLNIISTVAIVFLNKLVYLDAQLKNFQVATAIYHFSVTFVILLAASAGLPKSVRVFEPIYIPVKRMISVSAFFSAAVVLGNVRLAYCSIGFFQLSKILLTPCTALLNYILFRKTTSRVRLIAIAVCCIGTAMTNTKEAITNPFATLIAFVSIVVAATYQIWIGKRMGDLKVSAPQLLLNQAPISVVILLFLLPFSSSRPDFGKIQIKALIAFLASGVAAAGVNLSQFLIIGRTSALTFTIVGVAKTIIVVLLAPMFDSTTFTTIQTSGILLVTFGIWTYSRNGDTGAPRNIATESKWVALPNLKLNGDVEQATPLMKGAIVEVGGGSK